MQSYPFLSPATNLMSYLPNQAVTEYQARLAAQQAADKAATQFCPGDMVAMYDLKERVPNYNMLLNIGAGKGGLDVYKTADLEMGLAALGEEIADPYWYKPGEYHFGLREQFDRFADELDHRAL